MIVTEALSGLRLDQALARMVEGLSRNEAKVLIEKQGVRVGGKAERSKSRKVEAGEVIEVDLAVLDDRSAEERSRLLAALARVLVIADGPGFKVVDKPAGLPCTPYCLGDRLCLQAHAWQLFGIPGAPPPENGLVHRLDVGTSGLSLFATTAEAYAAFVAARGTSLKRRYRAIVDGAIAESGVIDAPIAHHPSLADRMLTLPATAYRGEPQSAQTRWTLLGTRGETSEVEVSISGGRRHQIRVHFASIGKPLRGDTLYGSQVRAERFALHAHQLHLIDTEGTAHVIVRDPPADFA